ncbi:hypothetical protein [Aquibium sp. ELW1220]|uniref:hypothetical protein n=1 Tax=Aquibium sp. ELW1220 TaxID=2976766 RepID=UPI0025B15B89|nr:hypothetical protein [Aquibium sp. ELW1220]MDN2581536.1 hypothetical protein [Aquibium sp. ELW1220]
MNHPLRHSHIAVRGSLSALATAVPSAVAHGEDDLGRYHFFDLMIGSVGNGQRVRFAAHDGDEMVHVLAEHIGNTDDLATALAIVGLDDRADLSISTDQHGAPLRDAGEIRDRLAAASTATGTAGPKIGRGYPARQAPVRKALGRNKAGR